MNSIVLFEPIRDPTLGKVVRRHLHRHLVTGQDPDVVHSDLAGHVTDDLVTILQFHSKHRVRQSLNDLSGHLDRFFLRQVLSPCNQAPVTILSGPSDADTRPGLCEDPGTLISDRYCMLKMRGQPSVSGNDRPTIIHCSNLSHTEIHHRLDRDY